MTMKKADSARNRQELRKIMDPLESELQGLEDLHASPGMSPDYLELQINLLRFRMQAIPKLWVTGVIEQHKGLIHQTPNEETIQIVWREFVSFVSNSKSGFPEALVNSLKSIEDLSSIKSAKDIHFPPEIQEFIREIQKPYFHILAGITITQEIQDRWNQGRCPICKGFPRFARLEKDTGARWLWCDFCDIQWKYERLTCPFCGHKELEKARFFTVPDDPSNAKYRVTVCDQCQHYVKTFDERVEDGIPKEFRGALVEQVATLHLDLLALQEGLKPWNLENNSL